MLTLNFGKKFKSITNSSKILYHWLSQRFSAVILIPLTLVFLGSFIYTTYMVEFSVYNLTSIFFLFVGTGGGLFTGSNFLYQLYLFSMFVIIFSHLLEGAQSIISDYVHQECTKILVVDILFKALQLLLIKNLFL